jgi:hypothetical protein
MFLLEKALLVLFLPWVADSADQGEVEAIEIAIGPVAGL